nr:hypothetical protein [Tanacetum cinerariifolium]
MHVVVWRNKPDLDSMSMDDIYNNLKVYEPEVKGVSSSSTNTQNMAFVSSSSKNNTNNSNEAVNTAFGVTTAGTQVNAANSTNIDNMGDAIICAFLASQSNSSQLVNEDLEQIHLDDLEEIDSKWQMAMLTMRAIRFLKNIGRKLNLNGNEIVAFDKTKVMIRVTKLKSPNYARMAYSASNSNFEFEIHWNEITIRELRKKLETVEREKDGIQLAVEKLDNASKSLNKLIDSQIVDNCKKEEFTSEPAIETLNAKTSKYVPKVVKKDNGALIIKDSKSDDEDESVP